MKTDRELNRDVLAQLDLDASIRNEDIAVRVKDGVATLAGTVDDYAQRWAAERALEHVPGVRAIVNNLVVKVPDEHTRYSDAEIAHAALNALRWDIQVPDQRITVKVADGWIMLEGEVEWNYQRDAAGRGVRDLTGVKGVSNMLRLREVAFADDVKRRITEMLKRQAEIDAGQITVQVSGHTIVLRGAVRSLNEKRDAERAVWNIPGITTVENDLRVSPPIGAAV
jgi:osmotically-inducible protein OsmY